MQVSVKNRTNAIWSLSNQIVAAEDVIRKGRCVCGTNQFDYKAVGGHGKFLGLQG